MHLKSEALGIWTHLISFRIGSSGGNLSKRSLISDSIKFGEFLHWLCKYQLVKNFTLQRVLVTKVAFHTEIWIYNLCHVPLFCRQQFLIKCTMFTSRLYEARVVLNSTDPNEVPKVFLEYTLRTNLHRKFCDLKAQRRNIQTDGQT